MRPSPLAIFALFCFGAQGIVGLALGLSNGLSETHKTVLVGFIAGFPALTLFLLMSLITRAEPAEGAEFRRRKSTALTPEPLGPASVNRT